MQKNHADLSVNGSGFVINSTWPHLGATPDGIVDCACCGKGVVEIKCPFCSHNEDVEAVATKPGSCLLTAPDEHFIRFKHKFLFVELSTVICVYAPFLLKQLQVSPMSAFLRIKNSGQAA